MCPADSYGWGNKMVAWIQELRRSARELKYWIGEQHSRKDGRSEADGLKQDFEDIDALISALDGIRTDERHDIGSYMVFEKACLELWELWEKHLVAKTKVWVGRTCDVLAEARECYAGEPGMLRYYEWAVRVEDMLTYVLTEEAESGFRLRRNKIIRYPEVMSLGEMMDGKNICGHPLGQLPIFRYEGPLWKAMQEALDLLLIVKVTLNLESKTGEE